MSDDAEKPQDKLKQSLQYIAALITACGIIVGAVVTIDNRYAKPSDVKKMELELKKEIDELHQSLLESEALRLQLGDDVKAGKILAAHNEQELAKVRASLLNTERLLANSRSMRELSMVAAPAPVVIPKIPPAIADVIEEHPQQSEK